MVYSDQCEEFEWNYFYGVKQCPNSFDGLGSYLICMVLNWGDENNILAIRAATFCFLQFLCLHCRDVLRSRCRLLMTADIGSSRTVVS
jgi:hypothetical protein